MSLARALAEATKAEKDPDAAAGQDDPQASSGALRGGERVPLAVGQPVEVRTRAGELVGSGVIQEMLPEANSVRVRDQGSGSDLQLDVDLGLYDLWVQRPEVIGTAPTPAKQPRFSPNRNAGARGGGRFDV